MIHFDQFLGDNFIRCFFRYYPKLACYTKEVFIETYREESILRLKEASYNQSNYYDQERHLSQIISQLEMNLLIKISLRLSHFPYALNQINPTALLSNSVLRNHGQLVQLKLVRVLNIFPVQLYLHSKIHKRVCMCTMQPEIFTQVNTNPLKIFKNQVNYTGKVGKHLYYETVDETNEVHCENCFTKYQVVDQKYSQCQKAEILALNHSKKMINLASNISTLWLIEPFVNFLNIGEVINFTGYYFMCPQQQMIQEKCISPLLSAFVVFDVVKVNPFHQMIGKDSALAQLFYSGSETTSLKSSKSLTAFRNQSLLTVDNIKMHDRHTQDANNKFYPRVNRLVEIANKRYNKQQQGTSTNFTSSYSIFDALYDMESFNVSTKHSQSTHESLGSAKKESLSQEEYKDALVQRMLALEQIDDSFGKVHLLVDRLFENQDQMTQNSNMFHFKLAMLISSIIQMKNTLVKFLEHDSKEEQPDLKIWTQQLYVQDLNPEVMSHEDLYTVFTPLAHEEDSTEILSQSTGRENINLLFVNDDSEHFNSLTSTLKCKGVKVVEFPSTYDAQTTIPFLLMNDHSIIVFKNPKKDILNLLKLIMRKGVIFFKQQNQPIRVNLTIWVFLDAIQLLDKIKGPKKSQKNLTELILKEYGSDFINLFDIAIEISNYSQVEVLGTDYLKYTDNLVLDRLSINLDQNIPQFKKDLLFEFKDLKCFCKNFQPVQAKFTDLSEIQKLKLSIGEHFIQYYYLCQRKQHQENDTNSAFYKQENGATQNDKNWMTLSDVVKVKKIADSINFLRLFFLKSSDEQINQIQLDKGLNLQQIPSSFKQQGLEIIDCKWQDYLLKRLAAIQNFVLFLKVEAVQDYRYISPVSLESQRCQKTQSSWQSLQHSPRRS
eukprot:403345893